MAERSDAASPPHASGSQAGPSVAAGRTQSPPRAGSRGKQQHVQQNQQNQQQQNGRQRPHRHRRRKGKDAQLKQPPTRDMPRVLSELLNEPKQALLHRVVRHIGPKHAWQLLRETLRLEQQGGQAVNAVGSGTPSKFLVVDEQSHELKARRRTTGGVYLALLKEQVPRDTYRAIYEIEDKKKKEAKKRGRQRQRQRMDNTLAQLGFDDLTLAPDDGERSGEADAAGTGDEAMEDGEVS